MRLIFNYQLRIFWCLAFIFAIGMFQFAGDGISTTNAQKRVKISPENNTPQALPFSQNWSNVGLITANDDWANVPGIVGFLGNYDTVNAPTNVDPRTLTAPFVTNDVDVIANQNMVGLTNGGVAEFDGIANPVVALNGSGTADAPSIVIYINTTGLSNITFVCNIRDIDDTTDNSTQQVDVQWRAGGTGNYASVTGGYIADASSGPSTTMTTPLNLLLPAGANNQAMVEIRVITTNAGGNDEWIGADDISITGTPIEINGQHVVDMNGDGKTDWAVVRAVSGQLTWFTQYNGLAGSQTDAWGLPTDHFTPGDFDGDNKTDIAVWRSGAPGVAGFYILQSSGSVRVEQFGQTDDRPEVTGDYDGDGDEDIAVYRPGANPGDPSFWYYRLTPGGPVFNVQWGQNADFEAPGDYDGDGKNDFVIQRNAGGGQARFWIRLATGATSSTVFGTPSDVIVPGDYDGDGKTDIAVYRDGGGVRTWFIQPSSGGAYTQTNFGDPANDFAVQGDYDGDGKTDIAIWRPSIDPTQNFFIVNKSSGGIQTFEWGQITDTPVANYNTH